VPPPAAEAEGSPAEGDAADGAGRGAEPAGSGYLHLLMPVRLPG
jgi:hypothetical protein